MNKLNLAFDKASQRHYDADGRLHVALTNISKSNVCPYYGREIPECEALGLDESKIYQLLRDPGELKKAAASSNNIPLLSTHIPLTVDEPQKEAVVGSTGTDAVFNKPYLQNSLVVWDAVAIAGIESEEQKELSCGYRYTADMTAGSFEGVAYDGVMRNIVFNHVALVEQGRAGSDVVVGDSKLETSMSRKTILSRKAAMAKGALSVYLKPKLAQDGMKIDLNAILASVTSANWAAKKSQIVAGLKVVTKGKLAQDADIADIVKLLDSLDGEELEDKPDADLGVDVDPAAEKDPAKVVEPAAEAKDEDPCAAVCEFLKGKISDEDLATVENMMSPAADAEPEAAAEAVAAEGESEEELLAKLKAIIAKLEGAEAAEPEESAIDEAAEPAVSKAEPIGKAAMDAAINQAVKKAKEDTVKCMHAIAEAKAIVRPLIGEISIAQDSAEAIYRLALEAGGIDVSGVHPSAFKSMVAMLPKQTQPKKIAQDSGSVSDFNKKFPEAGKVRQLG